MLSHECTSSASETKHIDRQCYLHMERVHGTGMECPIVGLSLPFESVAFLNKRNKCVKTDTTGRKRQETDFV